MTIRRSVARFAVALAANLFLAACGAQREVPEYRAFAAPERVTIRGYDGDAMEPFVTRDARYLLFNNRNDSRTDTNLHFAERMDDLTFIYRGEIRGINSTALDGVPSVDRNGNLFFVSTRTYQASLSTLYSARFADGAAAGVELVPGVSRREPGIVMFDAEVAEDGDTLLVVDGRYSGGEVPDSADIVMARREGSAFRRVSEPDPLRNVNTPALEYAPALSRDLKELFFTRLETKGGARPVILRAVRASVDGSFGFPARLAAMKGFVEAPTLSGDGRSLYYHQRAGERFVIMRVARTGLPAQVTH